MTVRTATRTKSTPKSRPRRALVDRSATTVYPPDDASQYLPPDQWAVFKSAMDAARAKNIPFALGGGLAVAFYTGLWRGTKDVDLYVLPTDRDAMVEAVSEIGLADYYDKVPYDRRWIYRATQGTTIVDIIWALANNLAQTDDDWLTQGPSVELFDDRMNLVPAEELLYSKIHVLQRERCDWPDIENVLYAAGPSFDWERLIGRLAGEERLLASVVLLFSWLAPGRAETFPDWIWSRLEIPPPEPGPIRDERRIIALDSRPWFVGVGR